MRVMDQPVNQRSCEPVVPEDGIPLRKLKMGCNDLTAPFTATRDHLEQQFCCILMERNKSCLVQYDRLCALHSSQESIDRSLAVFLRQRICQRCRCKKAYSATELAGLKQNCSGQMRFTRSNSFLVFHLSVAEGNLLPELCFGFSCYVFVFCPSRTF